MKTEKTDTEKARFEGSIEWATVRWRRRRIKRHLVSCALAFCTIIILTLTFQSTCVQVLYRGGKPEDQLIPSFVVDYAPLVWLDEHEEYFPSSLLNHVNKTRPAIDLAAIALNTSLDLSNLDLLNSFGAEGYNVYLTSKDDVTTSPPWLAGTKPDSSGRTASTSAVIIVVHRQNNTLDAFYTYFYSFNRGAIVLGHELGDHIGDWEHNMIRFVDGVPQAVWYSQHGRGQAFAYDAVEKIGARPVGYSARGTHANYGGPGRHDILLPKPQLPFSLLVTDYTSNGTLWDPVLNAYWYTYDVPTEEFHGVDGMGSGDNPVGAMKFKGKWGDQQYTDDDERQERWLGWRKFVDGPTGPWDKELVRDKICPDRRLGGCTVKQNLRSQEMDGVIDWT